MLNLWNVLLVVVGFGLVIFIHELGHFIAARWAGIRVHAFALGFGPALVSWRKGLGFRMGSSEPELESIRKRERDEAPAVGASQPRISDTEYRLNILPLGGYVRMLGQEDANPGAVSNAPDSFTAKPVWKRMVVVSAGVIMNVILSAIIFVGVFLHGIDEPPAVAGRVVPDSPAARAGLLVGDIVTAINGNPPSTFLDLQVAAALSGPGEIVRLDVTRADGSSARLDVNPVVDPVSRMRSIGVEPAFGALVADIPDHQPQIEQRFRQMLELAGLPEVRPGMRLTEINGAPVTPRTVWRDTAVAFPGPELRAAAATGEPMRLTFTDADGTITATVNPWPQFTEASVPVGEAQWPVEHLLGLTPVIAVKSVQPGSGAETAGLRSGDIFARIGSRAWPAIGEGITEIRAKRNATIDLLVLRDGALLPISAPVDANGFIGFIPGSGWSAPIVAATPQFKDVDPESLPANRLPFPLPAGTRIDTVNGAPVADWAALREAIRAATDSASTDTAEITLGVTILAADALDPASTERITLRLTSTDIAAVHALAWDAQPVLDILEFAMFNYKASGPVDALMMGIGKTHRYMLMTYVTLQRLFQNTVKVEHLKGPVGIAHVGSQVADRGLIYLLFFLGVISINLAVVNFLPLPIVDGGLFLMLVYEAIVRRPVPMVVQNALTLVGLALIGSMFLVVTFHDIRGLF